MAGGGGSAERELRSCPAFAEVLHFVRTFLRQQPPFPAERLEQALLSPAQHEFPRWFYGLAFALCRGPVSEEERRFGLDPDPDEVWEHTLRERVEAMHTEAPEKSPLHGGLTWFDLTAVQRVELLRAVCWWRLDELTDELTDGVAAAEMRAEPFGADSEGCQFFSFGTEDCYVFRAGPEKRPPKGGKKAAAASTSGDASWETVCTTLSEVKAWAKRLKASGKKSKPESELLAHVTDELMPSLEETTRERALRKAIEAESLTRKKSSRLAQQTVEQHRQEQEEKRRKEEEERRQVAEAAAAKAQARAQPKPDPLLAIYLNSGKPKFEGPSRDDRYSQRETRVAERMQEKIDRRNRRKGIFPEPSPQPTPSPPPPPPAATAAAAEQPQQDQQQPAKAAAKRPRPRKALGTAAAAAPQQQQQQKAGGGGGGESDSEVDAEELARAVSAAQAQPSAAGRPVRRTVAIASAKQYLGMQKAIAQKASRHCGGGSHQQHPAAADSNGHGIGDGDGDGDGAGAGAHHQLEDGAEGSEQAARRLDGAGAGTGTGKRAANGEPEGALAAARLRGGEDAGGAGGGDGRDPAPMQEDGQPGNNGASAEQGRGASAVTQRAAELTAAGASGADANGGGAHEPAPPTPGGVAAAAALQQGALASPESCGQHGEANVKQHGFAAAAAAALLAAAAAAGAAVGTGIA